MPCNHQCKLIKIKVSVSMDMLVSSMHAWDMIFPNEYLTYKKYTADIRMLMSGWNKKFSLLNLTWAS